MKPVAIRIDPHSQKTRTAPCIAHMVSTRPCPTSKSWMAARKRAARSIAGDKVNFFAHYEIDGEDEDDVPHVLELAEYRTTDEAEYDSWLLLEALEPRVPEALEIDAVPETATAMET